jgi:hypothetical protein
MGLQGAFLDLVPLLKGNIVDLDGPPAKPDPDARLKELIAKLDETPYGTISKTPQSGLRLDQEGTTLALVKAALAALGSISPLVAALRGFLGLGGEISLSSLVARQNEAVRVRIESVEQFRRIFDEIFRDFQADGANQKRRVCAIFIDDLDRCMPDVALDILEAIKIFPKRAPCIFLVAADENLIGQGLRLRYKELLAADGEGNVPTLLARKGQEYFEKIIQLAIRVPYRTEEQTHRLIAALFPQWVPATDLIRVAVGDNPRRVKQFSLWLTYRLRVAEMRREQLGRGRRRLGDQVEPEVQSLINAVIALGAWDWSSLNALRRLTEQPSSYAALLKEVEELLSGLPEDAADPALAASIADGEARWLCERALGSRPLFALWRSGVHLSAADPKAVAVLAELADVRPDPEEILRTGDGVFMRILDKYTTAGTVKVGALLQIDLTRLMNLNERFPECIPLIATIVGEGAWSGRMRALETELERRAAAVDSGDDSDTGGAEPLVRRDATLRKILDMIWDAPEDTLADDRRSVMLDEPRLSRILPELVRAFAQIAPTLAPGHSGQTSTAGDGPGAQQNSRLASDLAEGRRELPGGALIESALELRIKAARHFRSLRAFAKIVALMYGWPELAPLLRSDLRDLISLERELGRSGQPGAATGSTSTRWDHYRGDRQLIDLLNLKPKFQNIFPDEYFPILRVQKLAPPPPEGAITPGATPAGPPTAAAETTGATAPSPLAPSAPFTTKPPSPPAGAEAAAAQQLPWVDVELQIGPVSGVPGPYQVALRSGGAESQATVEPDRSRLEVLVATFRKYPRLMEEVVRTRDLTPISEPLLGAQLREPGRIIFESFFKDQVREGLRSILSNGNTNVRVLLELDDPWLKSLPWECLYDPELRISIGLAPRCSLVRSLVVPTPAAPRPLRPPLRVLLVVPAPNDVPRLPYAQEEMEILERILAERDQQVTLLKLVGPAAGPDNFKRTLRRFRPHIFHFTGHGQFDAQQQKGRLIFQQDGAKASESMWSEDLAVFLQDRSVGVAILNGCDTGVPSTFAGALTGVAEAIVSAGVPAAIAAMHEVADEAALIFTREFYRAMVDGETLETALVEARQALSLERWNWSAYALFSRRANLDSIRLLTRADWRASPISAGPS